jgi:Flp pilus assembly protein TadG
VPKAYILCFTGPAMSRRFLRCERGSPAIEFAALAPVIVAVILATLQVAVIFLAKAYLETATEAASRFVMTNQSNSLSQAQFKTQLCNNISALFTCAKLIVELQQAPSTASQMSAAMPQFDANGTLTTPARYSIASAPAKMMLIVMYQWPVFGGPLGLNFANMGNGTLLMSSTQIFQIEPAS